MFEHRRLRPCCLQTLENHDPNRGINHLGVTVQLDDFGTGYSSLTVLHDFPGDTLKIDRSFVDTMIDRAESHTIIRSIVVLAHNLGLRVIAEGIENADQVRALTALDCEYGQGYHFAHPLPSYEVESLLASGHLLSAKDTRIAVGVHS
ncbi:MAG: EAL domain-containing protein [Solirubrobacteraceae bacterium]